MENACALAWQQLFKQHISVIPRTTVYKMYFKSCNKQHFLIKFSSVFVITVYLYITIITALIYQERKSEAGSHAVLEKTQNYNKCNYNSNSVNTRCQEWYLLLMAWGKGAQSSQNEGVPWLSGNLLIQKFTIVQNIHWLKKQHLLIYAGL